MVRTSTTSRTSAFFSKPTKTSSGRTECPIVKNGFAIYAWRRAHRNTDPFAQGGVIALSALNLVLWVVHTHGQKLRISRILHRRRNNQLGRPISVGDAAKRCPYVGRCGAFYHS